ncbi:MAG: ribbon-helix-helix protein, CopG family [Thermoleophilia bacterium]
MGRESKVMAVSMPPEMAKAFERIAVEEGRTKSELFREMLRVYQRHRETRRLQSLQRYGVRPGDDELYGDA